MKEKSDCCEKIPRHFHHEWKGEKKDCPYCNPKGCGHLTIADGTCVDCARKKIEESQTPPMDLAAGKKCFCACHDTPLGNLRPKGYAHETKCCEKMNGYLEEDRNEVELESHGEREIKK